MTEQREWAKGRSWWITAAKPEGGFVLIRENALYSAWEALQDEAIELRDFRVWLACFELTERRLAAQHARTPRFDVAELKPLVGGVGGEHLRTSVRRLERAGLLRWSVSSLEVLGGRGGDLASDGRWVPVPRHLLRHLAKARGRAHVATGIAHILRCLYYRNKLCVSGGYCKASWVAKRFGVAIRAVKTARVELAACGFITMLTADQTRLNRFGSPVVVCLTRKTESDSAPGCTLSTSENARPSKHKELSLRRSDHQKPAQTAGPTGAYALKMRAPSLRDVKRIDLEDPSRLVGLFVQAERRGLIRRSDADKLAFLAAAEHAKRVGTKNVCGLFSSLVKRRLFSVVSQADEDKARQVLVRLRESGTRVMTSQVADLSRASVISSDSSAAVMDERISVAARLMCSSDSLRRLISP
jgi:hypothetical protein